MKIKYFKQLITNLIVRNLIYKKLNKKYFKSQHLQKYRGFFIVLILNFLAGISTLYQKDI